MTSWWERKHLTVSPDDLKHILTTNNPRAFIDIDNMNEVFPRIYLGNESAARDKNRLKIYDVTHVLNMAEGRTCGQVSTSESYYRNHNMRYLGIEAYDTDGYSINKHFDETTRFIDDAIQNRGKVLVHCRMGMSRSATVVLAYMLMTHRIPIRKAVGIVRRARYIFPNDGFLLQLCVLNDDLHLRDTS